MTDHSKSESQSILYRKVQECFREMKGAADAESSLKKVFGTAPDPPEIDGDDFIGTVNGALYRFILKHYRDGETRICLWRFVKKLPFSR